MKNKLLIIEKNKLDSGDMGYITYMHGKIYKEEYGYSTTFESYVGQSLIDFSNNSKVDSSRLWFLIDDDKIVGTIGVTIENMEARIRWFLIERNYRKHGFGSILLSKALNYIESQRISTTRLFTTSDLLQVQNLYEKNRFVKVGQISNNLWKEGLFEIEYIKKENNMKTLKLAGISIQIEGDSIHDASYSAKKTEFYKELLSTNKLLGLADFRVSYTGYAIVRKNENGINYFAGVEVEEEVDGYEFLKLEYETKDEMVLNGGVSRLLFDQLENEYLENSEDDANGFIEELTSGTPMDARVKLTVF